jgi:hypothetical protein
MNSIKNVLNASTLIHALPNNCFQTDTSRTLLKPHVSRNYFGREEPKLEELCSTVTNRATGKSFNLANHISASWRMIGLALGIEPNRLTSIERKGFNDTERLIAVFSRWLENAAGLPHYSDYPLSWQGLNTLLQDVEKIEVARQYFELLDGMPS